MPERIVDPRLPAATKEQLSVIPATETEACLEIVRAMGSALLPETAMVLLHEANSMTGTADLVKELVARVLGHGGPHGRYQNGLANPVIEGWARRFGFREPDAIADFRQDCHERMVKHLLARTGYSVAWETKFRFAMSGIAKDVWKFYGARNWSRSPNPHPLRQELDETAGAGRDGWSDAERREILAALELSLARIPPEQAEAVRRHDLGGERFTAIARDLGVDEGTVRYRRARGLERLGLELSAFREDTRTTEQPQ